jgi:hypothetical protein
MELSLPSNGGEKIFELHHVWPCALLHKHNKVGVSLLDLWFGCICIEKDHEPWDEGRPNLVHIVEEKMSKAILKDGMTR